MRADRLLHILLLMQKQPRVTAQALAQQLEVSTRTVHRDMEALSVAGVPVYAERGRSGGYALLEPFRAELHYLNPQEIQTLLINSPGVLQDLGLKQAGESSGRKLLDALNHHLPSETPSHHTLPNAERIRKQILIDGAGWRQSAEEHPHLALLHDALWHARQVQIDYRRADGERRTRTVHPLGLVAKGRLWYLVALPAATDEDAPDGTAAEAPNGTPSTGAAHPSGPRTYRISRIENAAMLPQPAQFPADFDLAEFWEASSADFVARLPRYPVTVWATPAAVKRLPHAGWYLQVSARGEIGPDGRQKIGLEFHTHEIAVSCLAGFGDQIEVIEPQKVAEDILALAKAICNFQTHRNFP